ncbi:unnamed protein product [Urochloa decumbens]|uniref:SAP domain-containing protein n=1 Tax=Urochloa decumbens TaxID=240449 RepID=A0ABC9G087_9POAL
MLTYPMLNDRPIDQWMVTELKDELQRRNLPVSGLKNDLVKRLFEAIQDKVLDGGEKTSGGAPREELKGGEIPGSVDASVNEASIEEHIDGGSCEVRKQGADLVISVTEAYDESILATSEVTQEAVIGTAEASQRSLDAVAEVESSLVDTAATDETNGNGLESASNGNTRVEEATCSEDNGDTIDKIPEDDTNKKMVVDDVPSDVTGGDIKLGLNMCGKILEMEDVSAPPDDNVLHGDRENADAVATAEPEDGTSKKMASELTVKVDCKTKQEVPALPDAIGESILATSEVTQEASTAEASQRSLDAVAEVESSLVNTSAMKTNGSGLESSSSGNIVLEEANPCSEDHSDNIEKTPEDDTNKNMIIDDVPSDVTGCDIKLCLNMHGKILEMEDVSAPPDDNVLHGDHEDAVVVATAEPEDDTSKKMAIKLSVKVDCKIEQEEVLALPDAIDESILVASEITQEAAVGTAEASQRSLDAVAEVESSLVNTSAMGTNGNGLESASSGNIIVEEANPHSEDHSDTIEETPEDDTNKKMDVDDVPSDVTFDDIKLGLKIYGKILEKKDVTAPPDDIVLDGDHEDADAVAAAKPEDNTSKKIITDDVLSDVTHTTVKLGVKADFKIEKEEVPTLPDGIELHADPKEADVVADFSVNTLMYGNGHGDPKCSVGDTKPFLCREKDQVSEVNPDLDSQIKCVSIFDDNISTNERNDVKGNLNADGCDLELEAKQEMVKPSATITSPGDHLQVLDVDKEPHKNGTSLQELRSTSNIDLDREKESPDGSSREKLNFDRSSGDESMDEDLAESKHADSNVKSDDLGGKTEVTSEHVLKEASLLDTAAEGSTAHTKEVVAEEKPPSPAEKRKHEDREAIVNNEPIKRQRLWKVDAVDISDQQASKLTGTVTQKEVFHSALKHSFSRPGTTASRDYPYSKERIVPPAQNPATTSLRIDQFVRPFTLKAVQELLGKTGSVSSFWMDHIKTHCYVTYSSVEEAVATRNAVYNLQWPPNNHNYLVAEFVDPQEVKLKLEALPLSQVPISPSTATAPQAPSQQLNANQTLPPHPAALLPTPAPHFKLLPASGPGPAREMLPPPPPRNLEPARTLDDLFKKTQAYPRIYYMPLSDEEVSAKLAAHNNGKRG